jgi:2'-phosphotransferase
MKGKGKDRRDRGGNEDTTLSKAMSWVLRHGAEQEGLTIDTSGYVPLQELLQYLRAKNHKNVNEERIRKIVESNDKKRFEI